MRMVALEDLPSILKLKRELLLLERDTSLPDWKRASIQRGAVMVAEYGGMRVDRLGERNRMTNALGFPKVHGRQFLSFEERDGYGTFFADIICHYGKEYYIADPWTGDVFDFDVPEKVDKSHDCGYGTLNPRKGGKVPAVVLRKVRAAIKKIKQEGERTAGGDA